MKSLLPVRDVALARYVVLVPAIPGPSSHRIPEYSEETLHRVRVFPSLSPVQEPVSRFDLDSVARKRLWNHFCRRRASKFLVLTNAPPADGLWQIRWGLHYLRI